MGNPKFLTDKEKKAIKRFSSEAKEKLGKELLLIKLFGSKVRGDFDKDSDIDILIVVKKDYFINKEKIFDILFSIDPYYEVKISPVIYSEYEYKKNKELESPFVEIVKREGINL
ncbi:MAG: hypothetical protein COS84_02320 [Armatimonadetes bacterium CG07_land_8_20_14_0_80_40_9]|nr:MAG: hypothetical protein COS84_02320 [Armatimonadetes bacterium CG07_land_8_20_14_0_80_40_9]